MKNKKIVVVSGCEFGVGLELVKLLGQHKTQYRTFALCRDDITVDGVRVRKCDVTKEVEISNVINKILESEERIDILVHCKNAEHYSTIDNIEIEDAKKIFENNVTSFMLLTSKILPIMQQYSNGHIVTLTSAANGFGIPFNSLQSASQFALEGFCDALKKEVKVDGIRVNIIQTGLVKNNYDISLSKSLNECEAADLETRSKLDVFKQRHAACYETMAQPAYDVAVNILKALETPDGDNLRYTTNSIYNNAIGDVYKVSPVQL